MTSLREAFVAAIKALMRGRSIIEAILTFWVKPQSIKGSKVPGKKDITAAERSIKAFLDEAEGLLLGQVDGDGLRKFTEKLKAQFRQALKSNPACMLPSYNYQLPNGSERGQYLALDVGGSTLRVALVELRNQGAQGSQSEIVRIETFKISPAIKQLEGMAFFDWIAHRISETVSSDLKKQHSPQNPLPMGLAWSFPIEQTSLKGGRLHGMGKGFRSANGLLGQDLGDIIKIACRDRGLAVELGAIINDSTAALLSESYCTPSTRLGLILGTGVNIAAHLPVSTIGRPKFGERPDGWFDKASHVIVNTELGMFGKDILPITRWDTLLNAAHPLPEFQPLEHLVSGYYLGEICRLALLEAINSTGIFGGVVPPSLTERNSLDTETLSIIEADTTATFAEGCKVFQARHPSTVIATSADIAALRTLSSYISRRSSAIVAASLYALWELKADTEKELLATLPADSADFVAETKAEMEIKDAVVGFNGSVIENYPGYLANCQQFLDELLGSTGSLQLVPAKESSLRGAAVALACLDEGKAN